MMEQNLLFTFNHLRLKNNIILRIHYLNSALIGITDKHHPMKSRRQLVEDENEVAGNTE